MMKTFLNVEEIKRDTQENMIVVLVLSTHTCSVCLPLKMKIEAILKKYPTVALGEVFLDELEEAKAEYGVFSVPIVLLFIDGKESMRYSAAMDFREFEEVVSRFVQLTQ